MKQKLNKYSPTVSQVRVNSQTFPDSGLLCRVSLKVDLSEISEYKRHCCIYLPCGELEETIRTPWYYIDEDYPARPEIQ